jgi:phosphopantothenoylcysteine decarboxylase/phosphopantothenate--cysteine ligase
MAEPLEIVAAVEHALDAGLARPLAGKSVLVTAGPTQEPLDPVRYLSNHSSGKQGYAIADALAAAGAATTLVSGPVALTPPQHVRLITVSTAREMLTACEAALPVDAAIFAAAVADWRPAAEAEQKIKKTGGTASLTLTANPDILATISGHARRPELVIGFAAETENVITHAQDKRRRKGCDWIVANDVSHGTGVMGGDRNRVHLVTAAGVEDWPQMDKTDVGKRLAQRIAKTLAGPA